MDQTKAARPVQARRARRIARRRGEILSAAALIFAEKGYANTTTRDIAEAVDMGESTLYNYFEGKRQILLAIVEQKRDDMDDLLAGIDRVETRESLVESVDQVLALLFARLPFTRTLLHEAWVDVEVSQVIEGRLKRAARLIEEYLRRHIKRGDFREVDPGLTSRIILGMVAGVVLPILRGVEPIPSAARRRELAEALAAFLLDGIARKD